MDVGAILELGQILKGVLGGDFSVLSTEGSLAGNESAADAGGSLVGSLVGSLGLEETIEGIPSNPLEIIGSIAGN
ncbi:hypothetical protein [Corynebacterium sp.]|uniref:hypothetical protein n=1 Tax=Corynebacterium sp. TaxID=1720 RepID=UPI003B3BBAA6